MQVRLALAICVVAAHVTFAQQSAPSRDTTSQTIPGTAALAGVVVTDDPSPLPVRRAHVTMKSESGASVVSVTTDDEGRFSIRGLAAGRYVVEASKPAWLTASYGAARPGRPGTPIVIPAGARIDNITLKMKRAGVIAGTVVDRSGQPMAGIVVSASRSAISPVSGEQTFGPGLPSRWATGTTDDEGNYRLFDLPPGDYLVSATLRLGPFAMTDLRPLADGEVDRVMSRGQQPSTSAVNPPATPARLLGYAPVYFPGTVDISQAQIVTLGAGDERGGVYIGLEPVPISTIVVTPNVPDDVEASSLQVYRMGTGPVMQSGAGTTIARRGGDGLLAFTGLTPGTYTILARAARRGAPGSGPPSWTHYGSEDVELNGQNVSVALDIRPGMTITGRLVFDGDPAAVPKDTSGLTVMLQPARSSPGLTVPPAQATPAGAFQFSGVPAARFRVFLNRGSNSFEGWSLKSVEIAGRPVEDNVVDVRPGANLDMTLRFTDRLSELAGHFEDASGRPATAVFILAFPVDPGRWAPLSSRIRQARPGTDGAFSIRGLPAGEYYLAALNDLEPGTEYDRKFLESIVPSGIKVTIKDGTRTVQDLRIR